MSRPPVEIDMVQLAALMRFKPRLADAAAFFKCSEDTVERRIQDQFGISFAEFREQNMVHTRMSLIQRALTRSEKSDVMLIFCLKNLCGWVNDGNVAIVNNNSNGETKSTTVIATDQQLVELIKVARVGSQ